MKNNLCNPHYGRTRILECLLEYGMPFFQKSISTPLENHFCCVDFSDEYDGIEIRKAVTDNNLEIVKILTKYNCSFSEKIYDIIVERCENVLRRNKLDMCKQKREAHNCENILKIIKKPKLS